MSDEPERFLDQDEVEQVAEDSDDDFEGHQLGGEVGRFGDTDKPEVIEVERLGNENERFID